jgi:uncharacterized protein
MRLSHQEQTAIMAAIGQADPHAQVYLYGSRANDQLLGGDIDLLLLSQKINLMDKLDILAKLHQTIGQRKIDLKEMPSLEAAATHLAYSLERCKASETWLTPSLEQMERLESLSARFARLSDLLVQRIFRLFDEADRLIQIRELRNLISHEYAAESMAEIYAAIQALAPGLLLTVPKVVTDGYALLNRYRDSK